MFVRVIVEVLVVNRALLPMVAVPFGAMALTRRLPRLDPPA
jgi:hypothetical protein